MKRRYLAFDLETAKVQSPNMRDWKTDRPLGISCAATLLEDASEPLLWHGGKIGHPAIQMSRQKAVALVEYLTTKVASGYTIVSWNGVGFDFDILAEESGLLDECGILARDHVDMMFHVLCKLGYGVGLDSAAKGMGLSGKGVGLSGAMMPRLWAKKKWQEVFDYVAQDVWITLELAMACEAKRRFQWVTRFGRVREMSLRKGWLPVSSAAKLPKPNRAWMSPQWSRKAFIAWIP